ncbi:MAG: hypothetical protein FD159_2615 [Syntrophaceae bacterium]|nr:MAG: hypothetical protein FD159_2615 [Syntrophaceae bacterium]
MVETKLWSGQDWDVFGEGGFNLQVHQEQIRGTKLGSGLVGKQRDAWQSAH